jgi:hypothetical protein
MEPISPLLWAVAFSAQLSGGGMHPWSVIPGGSFGLQKKETRFHWNQMGTRSSISIQQGNQKINLGKWAGGFWVHGAWKYKRGEGGFWYDVSSRKLATQWAYTWKKQRIGFDTHPAWGLRMGYFSPEWQVELGQRWRVQWQPQASAFRATLLGGCAKNSVYGAEFQWKKIQLNYRTAWVNGGQWRLSVQPAQWASLSLNASKDRWRFQSNQRFQLPQRNSISGVYMESAAFVHSRGIGWSFGAGKGIHRVYGASGFDRSQRLPWEVGWQTQGRWGQLGTYHIQFTAQKQANWSMQLRVSQGIQLGNNRSPLYTQSKSVPVQLECHAEGVHQRCQALLILKERETGNTLRFLIEGNTSRKEQIPEGSYVVQVIGPEEWEYQWSLDRLTVYKGEKEKKVVIYAKPLVFRSMN